ncbi:hypothetical protein ANN_24858 [Periplaneta americana]|uniref:Uncharacterized protein n=1 Tax=Periplaneta americana TaxID=6978 RepID=A0ABQ8S041_PERAM|nr:hypothetical protein ANN_24858 [Periplaneta americana]
MSLGSNTESYPAFAHIGLRENPGKNLIQSLGSWNTEPSDNISNTDDGDDSRSSENSDTAPECAADMTCSTASAVSYEIFPRRPNAISRLMTETRSARELRDETRKRTKRARAAVSFVHLGTDCNSDHYLVIGELRERLSVAKRVVQQVNISRFNIQKLKDEETKQRYQVEISNRFETLRSSDEVEKELDVNSVCENIRVSIKIAAEQSIVYYETKEKKPWFDEDCCMVVERREQAKLKFLQDPDEENRDNYYNERREASRTLGNKKRD